MTEFDQDRYTHAMLALGFAVGLCMRMSRELMDADYREDLEQLFKMVNHIVELNEQAEGGHARQTQG